ncbi:MAG: hypothetical protein H6619_00930 [Deltaproteobacteria bacterium]|nr:hypothetical protein [Deltaproteobacteria bacterium]
MKPKGFELSIVMQRLVYTSLGLLLLSGCAWLVLHYFFMQETDFATIPSQYEAISLQVHGAAVQIFLIVLGSIFPTHIIRAIKARCNLTSGIIVLTFIFALIISGYVLYYSNNESLRAMVSTTHWALGLVIPFVMFFHIVKGKKVIANCNCAKL